MSYISEIECCSDCGTNRGGSMNTQQPLMPFGKYRGTPINSLPYDYLLWLRSIVKDADLTREVERAIAMHATYANVPNSRLGVGGRRGR